MALNENKDLKKYYSIHEVAQDLGVAESSLRYWERVFPQLKPRKAGRNVRQYTKEDIEVARVIYNLVKVRGIKIANASEMLTKNREGELNSSEAITRLKEIRKQLVELRRSLNQLDPDLLPEENNETPLE